MRTLAVLVVLGCCAVAAAPAGAVVQAAFDCAPSCSVTAGATVTFTSTSTSSSPIRNLEWDLDGDGLYGPADEPDEPYGTVAQAAQRAFAAAGSYTVGLRVTNAAAEESTTTRTVAVVEPPAPPAMAPPASPPGADPLVPPQPGADEDGDGTPNARDLCPTTPRRLRAVQQGCSLVEAIVSPAALLASAANSVARARRELDSPKALRAATHGPLAQLGAGVSRLRAAGDQLQDDPCDGSRTAAKALRSASAGVKAIDGAVVGRQRSTIKQMGRLYRQRPKAVGDADRLETSFHALAFKRQEAHEALGDLARLRGMFADACRAKVGERTIRARVADLDGGHSLARLSDGTTVALGAASRIDGLAEGVSVEAKGTLLRGRVLVAETVGVKALDVIPELIPCLFSVKVAPVQDFAQSFSDLLYYDDRGYLEGTKYVLEGGMGIGAQRGVNCNQYDDYELHVFLDYRTSSGKKVIKKHLGSVRGFLTSESPVRIPEDIHPDTGANKDAKLHFELWGEDCTEDGHLAPCVTKLQYKTQSPAVLRPKGAWGTAIYDRKRFAVEDGSKSDFDVATLLGDNAPPGTLPDHIVYGVGYGVSGAQSSYPNRQFIVQGQPFAVHDDEPAVDPADYEDGRKGVRGGLFWAYLNGGRNGHPFHYVAKLPDIVTDAVSFCPGKAEDSYYRLPWQAGTIQSVTQGNNTNFTHKDDPSTPTADQKFAFDFRMQQGTHGLAPRGGLVQLVEEDLTENSNPKVVEYVKQLTGGKINLFKPANELRVRHQDGTVSQYFHMVPNGVKPKKDDIVERGDWVITVGNTGNSTGAHLHYHVLDEDSTETIQIRFEVGTLLGTATPCMIPGKLPWPSTNAKPGS